MGISDFVLLWDKLGIFGVVVACLFVLTMFAGSVVDISQFAWRIRRARKRREKYHKEQLKKQILYELYKEQHVE